MTTMSMTGVTHGREIPTHKVNRNTMEISLIDMPTADNSSTLLPKHTKRD